jgi:sarcosine oxidase
VEATETEFAVVGGGLLGLATARELSRRGNQVLLFERHVVGGERAGSKGSARVFRLGYDDPFYVRMAICSQPMWRDLEVESGRSLLQTTGQLSFGGDLDQLRDAMAGAGAAVVRLDASEVALRSPGLSAEGPALFEPESGVLFADRCLAALRSSCESAGAEVREHAPVTSIQDEGPRVRLSSDNRDGGAYASVAVVCAGHWTAGLLRQAGVGLSLSPRLEQVAYLAPMNGRELQVPIFIQRSDPWVYGLPCGDPGLLKVALHGAGPVAHPDESPLDPDPVLLARLAEQCRRLLPGYRTEPMSTERCFYDSSPDGDFVLDRVGRIVIGAGTTGHGFKFGPLLGEVLADLATGGSPRFDLGRFSASRPAVCA